MTSDYPDIERWMRLANLQEPNLLTAILGAVVIGVLYIIFNAAASPQPPILLQRLYDLVQELVYKSNRILDSGKSAIPRLARTNAGSLSLEPWQPAATSLPPAGLLNPFNGCYQHSVIQSLSSITSLQRFLEGDGRAEFETDRSMADHLLDMIENLNNPQERGAKQYLPRQLNTIGPLSPFVQQDAQEYFSQLLDKVDREAARETRADADSAKSLRDALYGSLVSSNGVAKPTKAFVKESAAPLRNPLEGLQAQRVSCTTCGYCEAITFNPFNCITLQPQGFQRQHIGQLLDGWSKIDYIEGVTCENCTLLHFQKNIKGILARPDFTGDRVELDARLQQINNALLTEDFSDKTLAEGCKIPPQTRMKRTKSKQVVVARSPKALVIHFNRSMYTERGEEKNNVAIQFDETLDLRRWCLGPSTMSNAGKALTQETWAVDADTSMLPIGKMPSSGNAEYKMRSVVQHSGIHNDGHYICYRKYAPLDEKAENWYLMNDERVYKAQEDEALYDNGNAYMLFYERPDLTASTISDSLEDQRPIPADVEDPDSDDASTSPTDSTLTADDRDDHVAIDSRTTSTATTPLSLSQEFAPVGKERLPLEDSAQIVPSLENQSAPEKQSAT